MAQNDDVIIVGSLDKKELEKSIQDLVDYVGNKTNDMASKFTEGLDKMKLAMKDFAVTQKVSVDLMKEAWRNMSSSFDAMVAAQSTATSNPHGGGGTSTQPNSIKDLKEQITSAERLRDTFQQTSPQVAAINKQIEDMRTHLQSILAKGTLKEQMAQARKEIGNANTMSAKDLQSAQSKLSALEAIQRKYANTTILSEQQTNRLATAIENCKNKIDKLKNAQPKTLRDVLGMDESSVDAIAKKMSALKKVSINTNNASEVNDLGNAYQRLSRKQSELLGKNIQLTHSNNYIAQSFGYIRNRIVYALTLGAVTDFTKQIYEVRGQYELLERSLGILIDNMRRGSEIFNELNAMALKSPFTLMELATGAKQLMAYNFAEDEVVDTTRRLADISSALGVPMERLVYNLGQIRAQTVLTARDARDFSNAGLAIVPMLADLYTKQKKFGDEIVTTSQVYDMMSNKMVSYADVMKVINSITDEGGKFFDFQAKQAETMKVQMNNLTLAWNNMLNEIGKNNQGLLTAPLKGLKLLFENWHMLEKAIRAAIIAMGMYYTRATLVSLINGTLITQGAIRAGYLLAAGFNAAKNALIGLRTVMITNPFGALAVAISTAIGYMTLFNDSVNEMTEYNNRFGESGGSVVRDVEALYGSIESLDKESATYKKVVAELNQILGDFNLAQIDEKSNIDEILKSREKNIQLIKEEILERKHLNDLQQGRDTYDDEVKKARERLRSNLSNAITENFFGIGSINEEIAKNAPALTNIISDIIESNIELVANKTGDEYEKGVEKIFEKIQERLKNNKALGLSEETINSTWLENNFFRFYKSNIITNVINDLKDAKEANDQYNESVNENYEAEKRAAEQGATFNDRVEQTSDSLLKAANDTDKFYGKINQLIKDYSGQNIIDFLVRVNAEVPTWMAKMNGTELARLSARFAALASQAQKAGKEGLNVNGTYFTTQQLYERAAQYASAVKQKQSDTESRKSTTITKEASQALQEYKQSLEAVRVAKNRLKQGTADQTLVTEKETEAQKKYNAALQKGVSLEDLKKAKEGKGKAVAQKDPLGDALQKEIQLINDIQKTYKEYRKAGVDAETAKTAAANEYTKSLQTQNAQLKRFGIKGLTGEQLATMDLREIRDYYQSMLDIASKLKNVKGVEALEKALRGINVEITKLDYKKITDGLNNELGKLKDEYELGIELDANPELGNIFADMMGIDESELQGLPRTFNEVVAKMQTAIDNLFSENNVKENFNLLEMLDTKKFNDWVKANDHTLEDGFVQQLNKIREYANKVRIDETKETTKNWSDLIAKYGQLQARLLKIAKDTTKEQLALVRKFGKDDDRKQAQDLANKITISQDPEEVTRLQRELAELLQRVTKGNTQATNISMAVQREQNTQTGKAYWDVFKNGDLYTMMFEDMSRNSTRAIQLIIDKMNELKDKVKEDPASMKALSKSLQDAQKELESRSSTVTILDALKEMRTAYDEVTTAKKNLDNADKEVGDAEKALKSSKGDADKTAAAVERLRIARERQKQATLEAAIAETKYRAASKKLQGGMETLSNELQNVQSIFGAVAKLFAAAGDDETAEAINAISEGFSVMTTVIMGVVASMILLESTTPWLLAIAAALSVIVGLVSFLSGNNDKKIEKQIKDSEIAVKRLENSYKNLQRAVEEAFGAQQIGARKTAIANKELQLVELQRQLQLEKEKSSKKRDAGRIADLEGQIIDLKNELKDIRNDITNSFLGISSVSDAVNTMMDDIVDALRNGEDAMQGFNDSIDDMIANMIKQVFSARILGPMIERIWQNIDTDIQKRGKEYADFLADYQDTLAHIEANTNDTGNGYYFFKNQAGDLGYAKSLFEVASYFNKDYQLIAYKEWKEMMDGYIDQAQKELEDATIPQMDDIRRYAGDLRGVSPELEGYIGELENILREMGLIKDATSEQALSKLQQGISGITEDTAGAIEAYMNSVSQQVYLQSDILTQIRDTILGFELDAQVATLSQMLLQLQQSYVVQQNIENLLQNVINPSGRAFMVELVS